MNLNEIKLQNIDQLKSYLLSLKKDFVSMSSSSVFSDIKSRKTLRDIRKNIARVYTIIKEKESL